MVATDVVIGRRNLAGTIFAPDDPTPGAPGVLFVHDSGSDRTGYAHRAAAVVESIGAVCLAFDLAGHGQSEPGSGPWLVRDHLDDVLDAYDALTEDGRVDPSRIGVCGASYGAYLAGRLAALRPVRRLVLRAPALYGDDVLDRRFGDLKSGTSSAEEFFAGLSGSGSDVLVVESGRDEVIPHEVIVEYLRHCPGAKDAVIAEARHSLADPEWDREFVDLVVGWFAAL